MNARGKIQYIHFAGIRKRQAGEVDLERFLLRQGEELIPFGHEKRLASGRSITVRGNHWYDHAVEQAESANLDMYIHKSSLK